MLDSTYFQLRQLAIDLLNKGRADGTINHEPDKFREQGYWSQLMHADTHVHSALFEAYHPRDIDSEDHLAHALTRILFAALLKKEEK